MRKQFIFLSSFLFLASVTFAQNVNVPKAKLIEKNLTPYTGEIKGNNANSQKALGQELWASDFSDPSVWTIGTSGQGTFEIGTAPASMNNYIGAMASTTAANGYAFFNGIQYLTPSPIAEPQNTWVQTEVIDFTGNQYAEISFQQRYRAFNYDVTYVEFSGDNGATWTTVEVNADVQGNAASIQNTLNLVFNVNNTSAGVFRFRWENPSAIANLGSGYGWLIDDVKISELADFELVSTYNFHHVVGYQYSRTPLTQVQPVVFRAGVKNQGSSDLTDVKLVLDINSGDATETSPAVTIASQQVDTLEASFTPTAVGQYNVARALEMAETDDNPSNNDIPSVSFEVTDFIYSIDKGTNFTDYPLTSLSIGGNPVNIDGVGMSFDIFQNQTIYGVDFRFYTGTSSDAEVYAELYKINPDATELPQFWGAPIAETDMFTLGSQSVENIYTVAFTTPTQLVAGETYLVLLRFAGGTIKIAAGGVSETSQSWLSGDHANRWGTFNTAPVVRANFNPEAGIANNSKVVTEVNVFPNPAKTTATVEFNVVNSSNVSIEVVDVTGKVVATKSLNNVATGANSVEFNVSSLASGVYTVAIKSNDSKVTRKLTIQ